MRNEGTWYSLPSVYMRRRCIGQGDSNSELMSFQTSSSSIIFLRPSKDFISSRIWNNPQHQILNSYWTMIESFWTTAEWFNICTAADTKDLQWVVKVTEGMIGTTLRHLRNINIAGSVGGQKDYTGPRQGLPPTTSCHRRMYHCPPSKTEDSPKALHTHYLWIFLSKDFPSFVLRMDQISC